MDIGWSVGIGRGTGVEVTVDRTSASMGEAVFGEKGVAVDAACIPRPHPANTSKAIVKPSIC